MAKKENYRRQTQARKRRERRKRNKQIKLTALVISAVILAIGVIALGNWLVQLFTTPDPSIYWSREEEDIKVEKPEIDVQLLTINDYSRPGATTERIQNIVVHYTANPGSTAQQNRDYFEGLKDTHITKASSNFIIGIDGEIIQCVPTNEIAYASNTANIRSVSIEMCHPDETGAFTESTYNSAVQLTAYLCDKFDLETDDVIRHYDVTGKNCPKYFVENEEAYEQFIRDIDDGM